MDTDQRPLNETRFEHRAGFTLIEIMAVVVIMGFLMTLVGLAVFQQVDKARVTTARAKIIQLESALEFYRMDNAKYPTTEQGLIALIEQPQTQPQPRNYPAGGYLKRRDALEDPWGTPFLYESPGQHNAHSFDLWSLGADQSQGGEDVNGDVGNWDLATGS
jgi:general secretion pathway protein G